mgnify:CR=1 FL=1
MYYNPMIQLSLERNIPNKELEKMNVTKLSVYPLLNGFITYEVLFSDFYGCIFNDFVREDRQLEGVIVNIQTWLDELDTNPFASGELHTTREESESDVRLTYKIRMESGETRIFRVIYTKYCPKEVVESLETTLKEIKMEKEQTLVVA